MTYLIIAAVAFYLWKSGALGGQKKPIAPLTPQTPIQQIPVYQAMEAPVATFSDLILQEAQRRKDEEKRQAELDAALKLLLKEKKDAA